MVSTGLPYLIVPVKSGLSKAKIAISDFEGFLSGFGAKFVYVYDVAASEGRTWDNAGIIEDVATGSAAGPIVAFLCRYSFLEPDTDLEIYQGAYVGRPSTITARVTGTRTEMTGVDVSGSVVLVASGVLENW